MHCVTCENCIPIHDSVRVRCNNVAANVRVNPHGYEKGFAYWPTNFNPIYIISCDGYSKKLESSTS